MRHFVAMVVVATFLLSCVSHPTRRPTPPAPASSVGQHTAIVHGFANGLDGIHIRNPALKLRIAADTSLGEAAVLLVEYPESSSDPAARDVYLDAVTTNWSIGRALSFRIRPATDIRLSVSFVDRNGVVYTSWTNLQGDVWQTVRTEFTAIRPNPYFQPPTAKVGAPLDLTEVKGLAFAPQSSQAGRLALAQVILVD